MCSFSASFILFRYSVEFIVEIWFFDLAIMRLINHASNFALFAKFFFSCIFALFVVFRDTTYAHEIDENAFFDAFWSLYCLEIKDFRVFEFEFSEFWTFEIDVVFDRDWINFIIWFNFSFKCDWIFLIFSSRIFSMRTSILDDFFISCVVFSLCRFCVFCVLCAKSTFCMPRSTFLILFQFEFKFMKFLQWFRSFKIFRIDAFWFDFARFSA